jgi:hypothetical protein
MPVLGQQAQGRLAEGVVPLLRLRLGQGIASLVPQAQNAIVLVDDDRSGGHEGAALVVGAGTAL